MINKYHSEQLQYIDRYIERLEREVKRLEKYDDTTILKLLHEEDIKEIERLNGALQTHEILLKSNALEIERLNKRFDAIKDYLKQIREENKKGILSSYNLIEDNIIRLCDGLDLVKESDNNG